MMDEHCFPSLTVAYGGKPCCHFLLSFKLSNAPSYLILENCLEAVGRSGEAGQSNGLVTGSW